MKTDLSKILAVSGQHGLYSYIAYARNGAIAESLADKRRTCFGAKTKINTLEDIAIYTEDGELKLREVFLKMKAVLGEEKAPSGKASNEELKALFSKAVPNYDEGRFYVSHMKKVAEWYNELLSYASFDFTDPEKTGGDSDKEEEAKPSDKADE